MAALRMSRRLALSLDEFGASALAQHAERYSMSPAALGSRAARYYLEDRGSGRLALRVPRLPRGAAGKPVLRLTVDLDDDSWRELAAEARRQDVSLAALLEHAILYLLADIDSGRAEERMLADLGHGGGAQTPEDASG
jgi:hypothetical protein